MSRGYLLVHHDDFEGHKIVMPAQAGIQEPQARASRETVWIPAFEGMTLRLFTPHLHCCA
jgi:hypothetical protein